MTLHEQLSAAIGEQMATVQPPVPDLSSAVRRGRRIRRRRRSAALAATTVAVIAAGLVVQRQVDSARSGPEEQHVIAVGRLDYSQGLRAFASPDENGEVWIGGRSFRKKDMGELDTDATATRYGMVFFDHTGRTHLLSQDGKEKVLAPAPAQPHRAVTPSAKADALLPLVAFTRPTADGVTVVLYDLARGRTAETLDVPCTGAACDKVRVDGVDRGLVFVRTADATNVWDPQATGSRRWTLLGSGRFRVADVRNGHLLWSSAPPTPGPGSPVADWTLVRGEIDAQLSYDGRHVLYWSPVLQPTEPGGRPIRLRITKAAWFTFDTDGSVLAAESGPGQRSTVYDCELPSGRCVRLGSVSTTSGDPMFIGDDM
jgi:hypothetical protein